MIKETCYRKINFKVKCIRAKDFFNKINCILSNTVYGRRHTELFTNYHVSWENVRFFEDYVFILALKLGVNLM